MASFSAAAMSLGRPTKSRDPTRQPVAEALKYHLVKSGFFLFLFNFLRTTWRKCSFRSQVMAAIQSINKYVLSISYVPRFLPRVWAWGWERRNGISCCPSPQVVCQPASELRGSSVGNSQRSKNCTLISFSVRKTV